jgi:RNA polymerase sigma-70 factor (ECF subfamily)
MQDQAFEQFLSDMRPRLHRYCARMTGSAIDGDDVVQDVLVKAIVARQADATIDNPEGWLFRIAHNAALDHLRGRARHPLVPLESDADTIEAIHLPAPDDDIVRVGFGTFLRLPVLQRCAVVLKDVLGCSVEEIAAVAGCSVPAAKSALQRGRENLKRLAADAQDAQAPMLAEEDRTRLSQFVAFFRAGDFDSIRRILADDVRLDLVARLKLQGRDKISQYFTRYGQALHWRFESGVVDGRPAMLVFDADGPMQAPAHFVIVDWRDGRIAQIRDFLFAPYALEGSDWARFGH